MTLKYVFSVQYLTSVVLNTWPELVYRNQFLFLKLLAAFPSLLDKLPSVEELSYFSI